MNSKKNILLFPNHHKYNAVLIRNYLIFLDAVRIFIVSLLRVIDHYTKNTVINLEKHHHHLCTNFLYFSILLLNLFIRSCTSKLCTNSWLWRKQLGGIKKWSWQMLPGKINWLWINSRDDLYWISSKRVRNSTNCQVSLGRTGVRLPWHKASIIPYLFHSCRYNDIDILLQLRFRFES